MFLSQLKSAMSILNEDEKKQFNVVFFLILVGSLLEVVSIYFFYQLIQIFLTGENYIPNEHVVKFLNLLSDENSNITKILILLLVLYVSKFIYFLFNFYKQFKFSNTLTANLSYMMIKNYMHKDYNFHIEKKTSDLVRNINTEVGQFTIGVIQQILTLATEFFILLSVVTMLIFVAPDIIFISLSIILLLGIFIYQISKKYFVKFGKDRQYLAGEMLNLSLQSLEGYKELKIYNAVKYYLDKFSHTAKSFSKVNTMVMLIQQFPRLVFEVTIILLMILIIFINLDSVQDISSNSEFLSKIGLLALASFKLIPSVSKIIVALQNLRYNAPSLEVIRKEKSLNIDKAKHSNSKVTFNKEINFKDVSFTYPKSKSLVLDNINLKINKGSKIGIMGESGSGKTTLLNLLIGLVIPTSGDIFIDAANHKIKSNLDWLNKISYVPQKVFMSDSSIRENIAFGVNKEQIDSNNIEKSAKYSNLEDTINKIDKGLDFNVGSRGDKLSLGQQQRIGIARAIYKNSEILIFDEFTSSLDQKNEEFILNMIFKNELKKTMIFISHKKNTLKFCDEIYFLENKKLNQIK